MRVGGLAAADRRLRLRDLSDTIGYGPKFGLRASAAANVVAAGSTLVSADAAGHIGHIVKVLRPALAGQPTVPALLLLGRALFFPRHNGFIGCHGSCWITRITGERVVGRFAVLVLEHFVSSHALQVELVFALLGGNLLFAERRATLPSR